MTQTIPQQKRRRETSPDEPVRAALEDARGGSRGGSHSSSSDDDEEGDERGLGIASSAHVTGLFSSGGTSRRRSAVSGGAVLSASSALELFGLRHAAATAPQAQQQQQPPSRAAHNQLSHPVSFLRAASPSALTHVASRLAQMDARSFGGAGVLGDEVLLNENVPASTARISLAAGSSASVPGRGASAHGLPPSPSVATLPAIASALTAATSDFQRKSALRAFLSSDEGVEMWLPQLITVLGSSRVAPSHDASDSPTCKVASPPAADPILRFLCALLQDCSARVCHHHASFVCSNARRTLRTSMQRCALRAAALRY